MFPFLFEDKIAVINIIRDNYWPLILSSNKYYCNIYKLSKKFKIPYFVIKEYFVLLQAFGFINKFELKIDKCSNLNKKTGKIFLKKFQFKSKVNKKNLIKNILSFLELLSNMQIILNLNKQKNINNSLINGLFRISSLFDINIDNFNTIEKFNKFLYIGIKNQEKIFGNSFSTLLKETSGMQIIGYKNKEKLKLSNNIGIIKVGDFFQNGNINKIIIRMIPGYSPLGVMFKMGINFNKKNCNYFLICGSFFEIINEITIPVIGLIQYNLVNIGIENNLLTEINEFKLLKNQHILTKGEEISFYGNINKNLGQDAMELLIKHAVSYFINNGYPFVEIINPIENLWLYNHNKDRNLKSIEKSGNNMYTNKGLNIGGELLGNGRVRISTVI